MRVLIYDSDFSSSGIKYPIKEAFEKLGHKAEMFDWRKFLYTYNNNSLFNRIKDKLAFEFICLKINKALKEISSKNSFDLILILRGEHLFPETIEFLKKNGKMVVNWNTDDLFNKFNSTRFTIESFPLYDIHFSPRRHLKEEYIKKGAKRFEFLNWYYRANLVQSESEILNPKYFNDISFVGSWSMRREQILFSLQDHNLNIYGWGWNKYSKKMNTLKFKIKDHISMNHMMQIFSKSKINLNILTLENRDTINLRNFELSVAGAFQITERSNEITELFEEDKDIVCFSDVLELESKIKFYKENDLLRDKIRLSAYNKILKGKHELIDRIRQITEIVLYNN